MWSPILLCLIVAFAYASEHPAWEENKLYTYEVRGRSFASLNQISNVNSGILIKARLAVQLNEDGKLGGVITDAQYVQINRELSNGWETDIPDSEVNYEPLDGLSYTPFEIELNKGAIRDIFVEKKMRNWEVNMVKGIVSQLQLDTKASNLMVSSINILTQDDSNTAVFKTTEETVTGVAETLYEIHPYPNYVLQTTPWVVPQKELIHNDQVIEVVKHKNYTYSPRQVLPSYHADFEGIHGYQPQNKIADFMSRTSVSQAVVTGSLKAFVIQNSVTTEEIVLRPTLADQQKGSVNTKLNLTLLSVLAPLDQDKLSLSDPVGVGVVYGYNNPFGTDNGPRPADPYDHSVPDVSSESQSADSENSYEKSSRTKRSTKYRKDVTKKLNFESYQTDNLDSERWHQKKPKINEAPASPLLPFTVAHGGQAIKKQQNIVETVRKLADQVGGEFQDPNEILRQHTVGKFVTLVSLVRTMDHEEVKKVAAQLYPASPGQSSPAWVAYRDAVAQSGTSPALLNIKEWIKSGKVSGREAAEVIASTANAPRAPTEEHMKEFFEIIKDEDILSKPYVNESAILSYTDLAYTVHSNAEASHGKFPVYSFGSFNTQRGQDFVRKTVIPHLTRKLHEAISKADTRKIHVYIRALGNVGQQYILEAFEPYLEGTKKASHFQRVLMVTALDRLVESNPTVGRSVLYKIYRNPSEAEPVRVAAVFQLMRTNPPADMLQRMASYTNVDSSNYVNAAVKSSIESASQLEEARLAPLREAAESAKPLLTTKEFGVQFSQGYLRSYVFKELQLGYEQYLQSFGGEDYAVPKGIKYSLSKVFGGVSQPVLNMQAMTSSVEDLINVYQQQTKEYQDKLKEKQNAGGPHIPWISENAAKRLDIKNEQREQLEGNLYLQANAWQEIFSFDNHTLANLSQVVQELEEEFSKGKSYKYNKMLIGQESSLALPTALGLPFVYVYDRPALVRIQGDVKAHAEPRISTEGHIQKPDRVHAEFEIKATVTGRVQTQLAIITPFNHQRSSAGYIKNYQINVPLSGKLELNVQNNQVKVEVQNPAVNQDNIRLAHYSSWPYTSQGDVFSPRPELNIIRSKNPYRINQIFGQKSTGVALYLHITSDEIIDTAFIYDKLRSQDPLSAILSPWVDDNIQYVHVDVGIDGSLSTAQQVNAEFIYRKEYQPEEPSSANQNANDEPDPKPDQTQNLENIPPYPDDPKQRINAFLDKLRGQIHSSSLYAADATAEFLGQSKMKYSATVGISKSNVSPLGLFMALFRQLEKQNPKTVAYLDGWSYIQNTNGLNMDYAMKMKPDYYFHVDGLLDREGRHSKASSDIEFFKSEERVHYLKQLEDYKKCKREMQEGNNQLPVCAKMTALANLLDKFTVRTKYSDMDPKVINATYTAYSVLRHSLYPRIHENIVNRDFDGHLDVDGQFSPDLHALNVSVRSEYGRAEIQNVPMGPWYRQLLVQQPVFHAKTRLAAQAYKYDTYRPICVIDKSSASTFDNKTYPARLRPEWTVALQYIPRRPSNEKGKPYQTVLEQLAQQIESYVVYVRAPQNSNSQKEVLIALQMPSTQGKPAIISMKPRRSANQPPRVYVNDQEVIPKVYSSADFYNGNIQIYRLPNNELKVEVHDAFYVIFDGQTVKLTAVNSKFRDASRGLCGTFSGEQETDFLAPNNCILHKSDKFVESYTLLLLNQRYTTRRAAAQQQEELQKCYQKKVSFANYISNRDAGRTDRTHERQSKDSCSRMQTQYMEQGNEVCFTLRPLPLCKDGCAPRATVSKQVDVYCAPRSMRSVGVWMNEIRKGASPDFSEQTASRKVRMEVPQSCMPRH